MVHELIEFQIFVKNHRGDQFMKNDDEFWGVYSQKSQKHAQHLFKELNLASAKLRAFASIATEAQQHEQTVRTKLSRTGLAWRKSFM